MKLEFLQHKLGNGWQGRFKTKKGLELSVLCGECFYSNPRENLSNTDGYNKFELAIFINGDWASYKQLEELGIFKFIGTKGDYEFFDWPDKDSEDKNKPSSSVFCYVPREKIIGLIENY